MCSSDLDGNVVIDGENDSVNLIDLVGLKIWNPDLNIFVSVGETIQPDCVMETRPPLTMVITLQRPLLIRVLMFRIPSFGLKNRIESL